MNKVILIGRLTRDPELRMAAGSAVVNFSLACDSGFNRNTNELATEFINCSVWGRNADNLAKFCKKGSMISAEGRIRNGSYTAQDGTKRYTSEVVCEDIRFLSRANNTSSSTISDSSSSYFNENNTSSSSESFSSSSNSYSENSFSELKEDPFKNFSEEITLTNDDLPF